MEKDLHNMSDASAPETAEDDLVVLPADRTEAEKQETYGAEWVTPIHEMSLLDRVVSLFRKSN